MNNFLIYSGDLADGLKLACAGAPLLAALAGFLVTLGQAAYYRIITECGAPSLQSFALHFIVAAFAVFALMAVSFIFSIGEIVLLALAVLCVAAGIALLLSLRREASLPHFAICIAALVILLIVNIVLYALGVEAVISMGDSDGRGTAYAINTLWLADCCLVSCGLFYEAGYLDAMSKRIYLINEEKGLIVLTVCSGGRAFVRKMEKDGAVCRTGERLGFVSMDEIGMCRWMKFEKVIIDRG